jgi:hypothetical protein
MKLERTQIKKLRRCRGARGLHAMAAPLLRVMRVECVVAGYRHKEFIEKFNLPKVAKVILDNQCFEWRMDGGNSGSLEQ